MNKIKIGEREIPLRFTMEAWEQLEEEVGFLHEFDQLVEGRQRIKNLVKMVRIMGNAGLKDACEKPDLTDEWIKEHMKPTAANFQQAKYLVAITLTEDMQMETKKAPKERDVVLEEIEKKETPAP